MARSPIERVNRGLDVLVQALAPYAERELQARLGPGWRNDLVSRKLLPSGSHEWAPESLLVVVEGMWDLAFTHTLGAAGRERVKQALGVARRADEGKHLTEDDTLRALDAVHWLLEAIGAAELGAHIAELREELVRSADSKPARSGSRQTTILDGAPTGGLRPWREVVTPHADVATGRYAQAEFAADLAQVIRNEGSEEYLDPIQFFSRTHITGGLETLLTGALSRLTTGDGDPVVELQTNFGGGKTHSMLALYHIFSGVDSNKLEGVSKLLSKASLSAPPKARRAVLVGTALSAGQPSRKTDGTLVHTLWGELAWQLAGKEGYDLIAASDRNGTSPGTDDLKPLFTMCSPCLVLIDEWVAYARNLVDKQGLPGGSFEAQQTFAQALSEAAKRSPRTLVVASIPASKIEIGGDYGERALDAIKNAFVRVATPWRPATAYEGFEIVRRRLFERIEGRDHYAERDQVVSAFARLYRDDRESFPKECGEGAYKEQLTNAYPIHPELFQRLYGDWSTLDKFQRTRGVLRLLAKVIHRLWVDQDKSLLIMPSSIPIDDSAVKSEVTRYLDDAWEPIIGTDVDGPGSMPLQFDRTTPTLGRYSACRRVARTIFIGTAPDDSGQEQKTVGLGDQHVRLGCVQPGETVGAFDDALRRISQKARHFHQDGNRYWISQRTNLNHTAEDRTEGLLREPEDLHNIIIDRLRERAQKSTATAGPNRKGRKGNGESAGSAAAAEAVDFLSVHTCPPGSAEVPDEPEARLVIFGPTLPHRKGGAESPARLEAQKYLDLRGNSPRIKRNGIVFVAPDAKGVEELVQAVARFRAWESIVEDAERGKLDLLGSQVAHAKEQRNEFSNTVDLRLDATWCHILVPVPGDAPEPGAASASPEKWEESKLPSGGDSIARRAARKLRDDELYFPKLAGSRLRIELDRHLWAKNDHVTLGELDEWFPRYLYLPRLRSLDVLRDAIREGAMQRFNADETFGVAEAWDEKKKRYVGLRFNDGAPSVLDAKTVVVKPEVARQQLANEVKSPTAGGTGGTIGSTGVAPPGGSKPEVGTSKPGKKSASIGKSPPAKLPTRFFASVPADPDRLNDLANRIADELLVHLTSLPSADAKVMIEIQVDVPGGIPPAEERIVRENANSLKLEKDKWGLE